MRSKTAQRILIETPDEVREFVKKHANKLVMKNTAEKAKELVNEFYSIISGLELNYISSLITFPNGDSHFKTAKQCAIIAVNREVESITILSLLCNFDNKMKPILEEKIKELNEVKTEIQNL